MASADSLRQRKPVERVPPTRVPATTPEEYDNGKKKRAQQGPDLEPNIWVVAWLALTFISAIVAIFYYKIDNRNHGPFASYVNKNYPIIDRTLNNYALGKKQAPLFGAAAAETSDLINLTEEELREYDGTDKDKPIYLGINGTIFDVSSSPAFYGPGGHYNHFVGKDATRAWITECWDEPEQFTWRLDDVEIMFMPKWLDELLENVGNGDFEGDLGAMGAMPQEMLTNMAAKAVERFGKVGPKTKAKRRVADKEEADAKVQETLAHWVNFFAKNEKYTTVGTVIRDESRPAPPAPCEAAMKKRPLKGGKLESLMGSVGNMMGGAGLGNAMKGAGAKAGEMPAAVKEQIEKAKKEAAAAKDNAAEGAETVKQKVKEAGDSAADAASSATKEAGKKAKAATDAAAEGAKTVKEKAKEAVNAAADTVESATKEAGKQAKAASAAAADGADTVKQKVLKAGGAAADAAESATDEAGQKASSASNIGDAAYEYATKKAEQMKDEAVKKAAGGAAAGTEKVKQKAKEVEADDHDEL